RFEPARRRGIFARQREVDEVASHRDVVRGTRPQIAGDRVEHVRPVDVFPFALPVYEAKPTFARQLRKLWGQRQMQVRNMCESEHWGANSRSSGNFTFEENNA